MELEIIRAELKHQTTFRNLFQFYIYEFSRFMGWPVTLGGRFMEDDLEGCWTEGRRDPFLIRYKGDWAGLAIVDHNAVSRYTGESNVTSMAEFFVMAAYRRKGIGSKAATHLFDQHAGGWEVFQHAENIAAQKFWRRVIYDYTGGSYREIAVTEPDGMVQVFMRQAP